MEQEVLKILMSHIAVKSVKSRNKVFGFVSKVRYYNHKVCHHI